MATERVRGSAGLWNPGPARRLRVVTEIPPGTARIDVHVSSGPDFPYFRIRFADGSWLGMRFRGSGDNAMPALRVCHRFNFFGPGTAV